MASMFPTQLAMNIAKKNKMRGLVAQDYDLVEAMRDFQRVAAVSDFKDALMIFNAHIMEGELSEDQTNGLKKIYDFTDVEVDGIIVDRVGGIMREGKLEANKLSAAQILTSIRSGESEVEKGAVKKVIFELEKQ